jgi:hypothetical protein
MRLEKKTEGFDGAAVNVFRRRLFSAFMRTAFDSRRDINFNYRDSKRTLFLNRTFLVGSSASNMIFEDRITGRDITHLAIEHDGDGYYSPLDIAKSIKIGVLNNLKNSYRVKEEDLKFSPIPPYEAINYSEGRDPSMVNYALLYSVDLNSLFPPRTGAAGYPILSIPTSMELQLRKPDTRRDILFVTFLNKGVTIQDYAGTSEHPFNKAWAGEPYGFESQAQFTIDTIEELYTRENLNQEDLNQITIAINNLYRHRKFWDEESILDWE